MAKFSRVRRSNWRATGTGTIGTRPAGPAPHRGAVRPPGGGGERGGHRGGEAGRRRLHRVGLVPGPSTPSPWRCCGTWASRCGTGCGTATARSGTRASTATTWCSWTPPTSRCRTRRSCASTSGRCRAEAGLRVPHRPLVLGLRLSHGVAAVRRGFGVHHGGPEAHARGPRDPGGAGAGDDRVGRRLVQRLRAYRFAAATQAARGFPLAPRPHRGLHGRPRWRPRLPGRPAQEQVDQAARAQRPDRGTEQAQGAAQVAEQGTVRRVAADDPGAGDPAEGAAQGVPQQGSDGDRLVA